MSTPLQNNLEKELKNRYKARLSDLDDDIRAMKANHSARGLLQSGATLKKVRDLCSSVLDGLADDLVRAVESVRESAGIRRLGVKGIVGLFVRVVPENAPFALERLSEAVELVKQPQLLERLHADVLTHHSDVRSNLELRIERLMIASPAPPSRLLLILEVLMLVLTAFLAGAWWRDPGGNYEPLIAIGAVVLALLEIVRRVRRPGDQSVIPDCDG